MTGVVRVAAVADLHLRDGVRDRLRPAFAELAGRADVLMLAGDLTNGGTPDEAALLCAEVVGLPVPVVAVLGNHDHDEDYGVEMTAMLRDVGVHVLDGDTVTLQVGSVCLGVAGLMGGGGGFPSGEGTSASGLSDYERQRRRRGPVDAKRLRAALDALDTDVTVALLHFAPITATLVGERLDIYPSLGCHDFAEAVDAAGADFVIHGHAHAGTEVGATAGGVPVRNVAFPVLRRPYAIYDVAASPAPDHRAGAGGMGGGGAAVQRDEEQRRRLFGDREPFAIPDVEVEG